MFLESRGNQVAVGSRKMCGSLLSKFKSANNKTDRPMLPQSQRVTSKLELASQDAACFQDREFWKNEDKQEESSVPAVQQLSSTDSALPPKVQTAVTFDIPVGDKKTVCPSARVPRRFRKRKVAPEPTLVDVKKKMRAAEERKLKKLQRIRECARRRAGVARRLKEEEEEIRADLQELETYHASDDSDSESWGDK